MNQTASAAAAVTPSDSVNLNPGCVALYVGTGGNISVLPTMGDVAVTLTGVGDGSVIPIKAKRINATGTTASNIVALY